jgi:uncharacterized protein YegP (UPF0339 family)
MKKRIELYRSNGEWRFRFVAGNGEIVAQSEGYENRADALHAAELVRAGFADAPIQDERGFFA